MRIITVNSCVPPLVESLLWHFLWRLSRKRRRRSRPGEGSWCPSSWPRPRVDTQIPTWFILHSHSCTCTRQICWERGLAEGEGALGGLHPVLCALRLWHHSSPTFSAVWIQSVEGGGRGKGVRKKKLHKCLLAWTSNFNILFAEKEEKRSPRLCRLSRSIWILGPRQ